MEKDNLKWRFAPSNHGERTGMTSGDTETFKKNPFGNFGREIIQNSIDARFSDEEPVTVEFKLFKINPNDIPDIGGYKTAIRRCMEYWKDSQPKFYQEYNKILNYLNCPKIECLRISDFNTTGLTGISRVNDGQNNNFLALTRSTGVSDKSNDNAGGSKGVGKNAAFLLSKLSMIFYSTITKDNEKGSVGVADLISGYCDDDVENPNRDYTQGKGYYTRNEINDPLADLCSMDCEFVRRPEQYGTDIFILGLNKENDWSIEILNSVLESFMVSIFKNNLIIKISNIEIKKDTLLDVINNQTFVNYKKKPYLLSQYKILSNDMDNVKTFDIDTPYGKADLYVMVLSEDDKWIATHKCSIIRYPYMKIFDYPLAKNFNVSALLIIGEDQLGKKLRNIENPQHNSWEPKRLPKPERDEMAIIISDIKSQIDKYVLECFKTDDINTIDPYGAGEFLPDVSDIEGTNNAIKQNNSFEEIEVSPFKEVKQIERNAYIEQDDGEGVRPDVGSSIEEGEDTLHPEGHNDTSGGGYDEGDETSGVKDGDNIVMKKVNLAGIRYKVIALDKKSGKYRISFIAPKSYENCYLNLIMIQDEITNKENIEILSMTCNGVPISSISNKDYGPFHIISGQRINLDVKTNQNDYFASEVRIYASQK